jgi:cyclopropane-fatty-acyl-phospholipid synthase
MATPIGTHTSGVSMMSSTFSNSTQVSTQKIPFIAKKILSLLEKLQHGHLTLELPNGTSYEFGESSQTSSLHASLKINDYKVLSQSLKSGDIGFAEGYIEQLWSSPDVVALMVLFIRNRKNIETAVYGNWLGRLVYRIKHLLNRNTKTNSRKNIHAHYDLGNAFYDLWLDRTYNYSSAWFNGNYQQNLESAQYAKVKRALEMVSTKAGDKILEIGCGWGAVAEMAALDYQAKVVGLTLSTEQLAYANKRLENLGLAELSDLRLQDYRDVNTEKEGLFDSIISIEMIEAVGQEYWPTYFQTVANNLKLGGKACIQVIVIADELFDRYLQSTDFIQQYVFPGGCLLSVSEFKKQSQKVGLTVIDEMRFGQDYRETLKRWREQFMQQKQQVLAQGFDQRFIQIWEFYLAYCEAAFQENNTDVVQFTLQKI